MPSSRRPGRRSTRRSAAITAAVLLTLSVLPSSAFGAPVAPGGPPITVGSPTGRWIVQLSDPALVAHAQAAGQLAEQADGQNKLDASQPDSAAYTGRLRDSQRTFGDRLRQVAPGARVERQFQTVLNGLAVKMTPDNAEKVRTMPGVRAVTPDIAYHADMFSTPAQIGAPVLWNQVGGQANGG